MTSLLRTTLSRVFPHVRPQLGLSATATAALPLHTSAAVLSMPTKKKKKADPAIERAREERRRKRIHKALRKMEKKARIPIPILEIEVTPDLLYEKKRGSRTVTVSPELQEERVLLLKDWNRFCNVRHTRELANLDNILASKQIALDSLRTRHYPLYVQAIAADPTMMPFALEGPTETPPNPEHIQDGEYVNVTKQFEVQYADTKKFMAELLQTQRKKKRKTEEEEK